MMTGFPLHARHQQLWKEVVRSGKGVVQAKIDSRSFPLANWGELPSPSQYLLSLRNKKRGKKCQGLPTDSVGGNGSVMAGAKGSDARMMRAMALKIKGNHTGDFFQAPHFTVPLPLNLSHFTFDFFFLLILAHSWCACTHTLPAAQFTMGIHVNAICTSN